MKTLGVKHEQVLEENTEAVIQNLGNFAGGILWCKRNLN